MSTTAMRVNGGKGGMPTAGAAWHLLTPLLSHKGVQTQAKEFKASSFGFFLQDEGWEYFQHIHVPLKLRL